MTTLSEQEREFRLISWARWIRENSKAEEVFTFNAGFQAGLTYNKARIEELEAKVKELEANLALVESEQAVY